MALNLIASTSRASWRAWSASWATRAALDRVDTEVTDLAEREAADDE